MRPSARLARRKADPYLSVKGVRDIASGLIVVILGDSIIVLRSNGPKAPCPARRP